MGCGCREIVGALCEKHVIIAPTAVDPTTTTYTAGDAIIVSSVQAEYDFFDTANGSANLVEFTVLVSNPTATPKKGIEVVFFSKAPSSAMTAAINGAVTLATPDIELISNRVQVVTADFVDCFKGSIARKTGSFAVQNKELTDGANKTTLWYAILATEAQTYTTGGFISVVMDFRLN